MRKVIDKNFSQDIKLDQYLQYNKAVIIDAFMIETFKNNPSINGLREAFSKLKNYPDNVEIMKLTSKINTLTNLSGRGLQKRLIDEKQTYSFTRYCEVLYSNKDDIEIQRLLHIGENKIFSNEYTNRNMGIGLDNIIESMEFFRKEFSNSDIKKFIEKGEFSKEFIEKFAKHSFFLCANMMNRNGCLVPDYSKAKNSYLFRLAVASMILVMRWLLDSGYQNKRRELLNNDVMDIVYIANATFFDGILSNDKKLKSLFPIINTIIKYM